MKLQFVIVLVLLGALQVAEGVLDTIEQSVENAGDAAEDIAEETADTVERTVEEATDAAEQIVQDADIPATVSEAVTGVFDTVEAALVGVFTGGELAPEEEKELINILNNTAELTGFVGLLVDELTLNTIPHTMFAPTDEAIVLATADQVISEDELEAVLRYHIVPNQVLSAEELQDGQELVTALEGQSLQVKKDEAGVVSIIGANNEAIVIKPNVVEVEYGIVHLINEVLLPNL